MMSRLLESPRWTAIYRWHDEEVVLNTMEKPSPTRAFRVRGEGRKRFTATSITPLHDPKEVPGMARTKSKRSRSRSKKTEQPQVEEEIDELEGLEGLEDDLEDLEEPEVEEEVEEEKPKRRRSRKSKAKGSSKRKSRKGQAPPVRELPKGKVGVEHVAELAGVDARAVRIYFRKEGVEKTEGRYAFNKTEAKKLASSIKKSRS